MLFLNFSAVCEIIKEMWRFHILTRLFVVTLLKFTFCDQLCSGIDIFNYTPVCLSPFVTKREKTHLEIIVGPFLVDEMLFAVAN